ncbi:MAG: YgjP-like metallopeptidase domain-containing protein [Ruminococcus callidus]
MKEQRKIVLGGETVSYTLERKAVKNINLRLRPDTGLSVSAPKYVALSQVERVLMQHQQKILETLRQYQTAAAERRQQYPRAFPPEKRYCTWEILYSGSSPGQPGMRAGAGGQAAFAGETSGGCPVPGACVQQLVGDQLRKAVRNLCRAVYPVFEAKGVAFPEIGFAGWSLSGETAARLVAC